MVEVRTFEPATLILIIDLNISLLQVPKLYEFALLANYFNFLEIHKSLNFRINIQMFCSRLVFQSEVKMVQLQLKLFQYEQEKCPYPEV